MVALLAFASESTDAAGCMMPKRSPRPASAPPAPKAKPPAARESRYAA